MTPIALTPSGTQRMCFAPNLFQCHARKRAAVFARPLPPQLLQQRQSKVRAEHRAAAVKQSVAWVHPLAIIMRNRVTNDYNRGIYELISQNVIMN